MFRIIGLLIAVFLFAPTHAQVTISYPVTWAQSGASALPFSGVSIVDSNQGATTDVVSISLAGSGGGVLSSNSLSAGSTLTGTGPYILTTTPANLDTDVQSLLYAPANLNSATEDFILSVTSFQTTQLGFPTGGTIELNNLALTDEVPFPAPVGTFVPVNQKGWNFSGMENTGIQPTGLFQPAPFQMDYLASNGFGLFRLPITTQFAYTSRFGLLNSAYVARIKAVVDYAFTNNLYVVIDPHNFGFIWDSQIANFQPVTSGSIGSDLFADFWTRLATNFKNYPNVIFCLMNEPSASGVASTQWRDGGVIPAIAGIRAAGATQLIQIPGISFTGAQSWVSSGNAAAFSGFHGDPLNNFVFEMHIYLDSDFSGTHPQAVQNGATILASATAWLAAEGRKGFIGEFGFAPDPWFGNPTSLMQYQGAASPIVTNGITQGTNLVQYMKANSGQWQGYAMWGAGFNFGTPPSDGGYAFNPEPQRQGGLAGSYVTPIVNQPQTSVLISNLP